MKKYILCFGIGMMALMGASGCKRQEVQLETDEEIRFQDEETIGEAADLYENEEGGQEESGEMVVCEDEVYQMLVPQGWALCENKIDESMLFEIQGSTQEQYIGVLALPDEVYGDFDSSAFMNQYASNAETQYEDAAIGEVGQKRIGEKMVHTLKITGVLDETAYINHVYVVEYPQETVIFTASMYETNEQTVLAALDAVTTSFGRVLQEESVQE